MDVILIIENRAHEIWRNATLDDMRSRFHPDLVALMVERPAGSVNEGDTWSPDTQTFA
jgi:hypothetical protein